MTTQPDDLACDDGCGQGEAVWLLFTAGAAVGLALTAGKLAFGVAWSIATDPQARHFIGL